MAKVNKKQAIKNSIGLGNLPMQGPMMAEGGDDVQAMITSPQGEPMAPAALKEGEVVFSIPAIIAAGGGDYEHGLEVITALHDQLKAAGEQMLQENSLANAPQG